MTVPMLRTAQRQQHTVTPRLQHAVRLLQLSSLDFAQEVHEAMGRNPFLEVEDPSHETQGEAAERDPGAAGLEVDLRHGDGEAMGPIADSPFERDSWQQSSSSIRTQGAESDISALDLIAADIGLRQHLRSQINVLPLSPRDHALACAIIESLEDDGYLRSPLDEIMDASGMHPPVDDAEMLIALKRVQSLDPCGVGARSVAECLQLQLVGIADEAQRETARRIVSDHLDRLAQHDVNGLARLLRKQPAEIEAVCEKIRHLNPRPGWQVESSTTQYITPDVIVRKVRGRWSATLNRAIVPRVRLNETYATLFKEHRNGRNTEMAQHLQEARWTVRNVQQRFSTILMVAEAILKRQQHFLEFGPMAMKPLGLREIAEELGLHESTVSRVTNNKYMATPVGVFELKHFFSREMATASGGACSATAIRGVIKGMIEAESPSNPLSDAQIARLLIRQGLQVARRTVTKYRQLLKLPSVERRRRIGAGHVSPC
ncbi:MAG: RNA polymerase factor sigma-54 [Pseudomonadota bacterium]|nr:RNA polymerase factor sigma-54 [Pseudomonadota bacterium]